MKLDSPAPRWLARRALEACSDAARKFAHERRQARVRLALATALVLAGCGTPEPAPRGEWAQWRGPDGQGVSPLTGLPQVWSAGSPNVRWRTEIPGVGGSSPVVGAGRVFLTTTWGRPDDSARRADNRRNMNAVVSAVDLGTGELLWQTPVFASRKPKKHWFNTHATPTPVTDGERVYAYFGSVLAALDLEGNVVWKQEVDGGYARYARYGAAASPVLTPQAVVVTQDREFGDTEDFGWIAAFDRATGRQLWRDEWSHTCCSYTTPILRSTERGLEVLSSTSGEVVGYDAASGARLWVERYGSHQPVPSMVTDGRMLLVPGGVHEKAIFALSLTGAAEETGAELLWELRQGVPEIASPLLYDGLLFLVTEGGILRCLDAQTGAVHWRTRLTGGKYHASLVAGDGKIYALSDRGITTVVAAKPELEILAENDLEDGGGRSSPAITEECLLIRTLRYLYCIGREAAA